MNKEHEDRIFKELKSVGVGKIGLKTPEAKKLVGIIYPDEHICGAVYGRYSGGLGWLVATDQRVIFLDNKPLIHSIDELSYNVVSGVKSSRAGIFSSVILHTRVTDYSIRFANSKCVDIFVKYIENKEMDINGSYNNNEGFSKSR